MAPSNQHKKQQLEELEEEDTLCGLGPCRSVKWLQKCANKKTYVLVYGILGCVFGSTYSYFNATISTLEKRYKIPSKVTGLITVGNDITSLFATMFLSYYAGKGHRPRWIAAGIYSVVLYCFLTFLPHLIWGPGEDALALTLEYGGDPDLQLTSEIITMQKRKTLCRAGLNDSLAGAECQVKGAVQESSWAPVSLLLLAQFISGLGGSLYYTLGVAYMDDNIKKSKTPALVSMSYFLRMLGPAIGYTLASFFLKIYISPTLTPTITNTDPRWLGAWWAGWLIIGALLFLLGTLIAMFPKTLPRAAQRRREALQQGGLDLETTVNHEPASLKDMKETLGRLFTNKIYMCNTISSIFYIFGYMPFWIYLPKYIEMQYHTSASRASFYTGTVGLVFSAAGILLAGLVITRFKPRARSLAAWNVFVALISVLAILSYPFLGCTASDRQSSQLDVAKALVDLQCNSACQCDLVKYSPVCSEDGHTTFISACHAGCRDHEMRDGQKIYTECSCIIETTSAALVAEELTMIMDANVTHVSARSLGSHNGSARLIMPPSDIEVTLGGRAIPGPCPVDCSSQFFAFIGIICLLKFSGSTGRTSNFLVGVRCIEERDKTTSLGLGMMLLNIFSFVPSPIIFGYIIDSTCVVWGKTCTGTGNCWQYDGEALRDLMNYTAAAFVAIGTLFDVGVWYYVKDLVIFDKKDEGSGGKGDTQEAVNFLSKRDVPESDTEGTELKPLNRNNENPTNNSAQHS